MVRTFGDVPSTRHLVLLAALFVVFTSAVTGCATQAPAPAVTVGSYASTIFHNGIVVTVNRQQPVAQALAVAPNGRILAVGDNSSVLHTQDPRGSTELIDLKGHTLMPGFVEAHTHVIMTAFNTHMRGKNEDGEPYDIVTDLSDFRRTRPTIDTIKCRLKTALPDVPEGGWLVAFGVDPSRTDPFMASLDVHELDEVSTKIPIFVINQSGHFAYVNHAAFDAVNPKITKETKDPKGGGRFEKDSNGELTGVIAEAPGMSPFVKAILASATGQAMTREARLAALKTTYQCFARVGITTASELSLGTNTGSAEEELGLLEEVAEDDDTPVRVRVYIAAAAPDMADPQMAKERLKIEPKHEEMLKIVGVKLIGDGSTQGLSAALNEPYRYQTTDGGQNSGDTNYTVNDLVGLAQGFLKQNGDWQLAIHSNGDRSTKLVLEAYAQLHNAQGSNDRDTREKKRWRIDHFTVVDKEQIDQVWNLGLTPSMTIGHVYYWGNVFADPQVAENEQPANPILGPPRAQLIDPAGWLLAKKIPFSFNSDSPVSPAAPLRYISTAVTRRTQQGQVLNSATDDQRVPGVDDAIRAVTIDAAYQLFLNDEIGSLEVGKWADLVILDKNPRSVDSAKDIMNIKVLSTWLKGVQKYSADRPSPCPK